MYEEEKRRKNSSWSPGPTLVPGVFHPNFQLELSGGRSHRPTLELFQVVCMYLSIPEGGKSNERRESEIKKERE